MLTAIAVVGLVVDMMGLCEGVLTAATSQNLSPPTHLSKPFAPERIGCNPLSKEDRKG